MLFLVLFRLLIGSSFHFAIGKKLWVLNIKSCKNFSFIANEHHSLFKKLPGLGNQFFKNPRPHASNKPKKVHRRTNARGRVTKPNRTCIKKNKIIFNTIRNPAMKNRKHGCGA